MFAVLSAGKTSAGPVEHSIYIHDSIPRAKEIKAALETAAASESVQPAAEALTVSVVQYQRLENAHGTLQAEASRLHASAQGELDAAIDTIIEKAAKGKIDASATWEAIDKTARTRRGLGVAITAVAERIKRAKIAWLRAQADWMFSLCSAIESGLEDHLRKVDAAMSAAAELEGGLVVSAPDGAYSTELKRAVATLSKEARQSSELAKGIEKIEEHTPRPGLFAS